MRQERTVQYDTNYKLDDLVTFIIGFILLVVKILYLIDWAVVM